MKVMKMSRRKMLGAVVATFAPVIPTVAISNSSGLTEVVKVKPDVGRGLTTPIIVYHENPELSYDKWIETLLYSTKKNAK